MKRLILATVLATTLSGCANVEFRDTSNVVVDNTNTVALIDNNLVRDGYKAVITDYLNENGYVWKEYSNANQIGDEKYTLDYVGRWRVDAFVRVFSSGVVELKNDDKLINKVSYRAPFDTGIHDSDIYWMSTETKLREMLHVLFTEAEAKDSRSNVRK